MYVQSFVIRAALISLQVDRALWICKINCILIGLSAGIITMCAAGNIITQTSHSLKRVAGLNFFDTLLIQSDWKYSRNWLNQTTEFCRSICKWGKYSSDRSKVTLPALHRIFIFALHRIFMYVTSTQQLWYRQRWGLHKQHVRVRICGYGFRYNWLVSPQSPASSDSLCIAICTLFLGLVCAQGK